MDAIRTGKFTSSGIVAIVDAGSRKMTEQELAAYKAENPKSKALTTTCKNTLSTAGKTYIKRKNKERKLGKSLDGSDSGRACDWGKFVEMWLMNERPDIIGLHHTLTPNLTEVHPKYPDVWAGSRDGFDNDKQAVDDIKCPYTLDSFCTFAELHEAGKTIGFREVLLNGYTDSFGDISKHPDGDTYYWQLVSNAHIKGVNKANLIVFCPTREQVESIKQYAVFGDHGNVVNCFFIGNADLDNNELPFVPEGSLYPNKLEFSFDIPQEDLDYLEHRVQLASTYLFKQQKLTIHDGNITVHEIVKP